MVAEKSAPSSRRRRNDASTRAQQDHRRCFADRAHVMVVSREPNFAAHRLRQGHRVLGFGDGRMGVEQFEHTGGGAECFLIAAEQRRERPDGRRDVLTR